MNDALDLIGFISYDRAGEYQDPSDEETFPLADSTEAFDFIGHEVARFESAGYAQKSRTTSQGGLTCVFEHPRLSTKVEFGYIAV